MKYQLHKSASRMNPYSISLSSIACAVYPLHFGIEHFRYIREPGESVLVREFFYQVVADRSHLGYVSTSCNNVFCQQGQQGYLPE